MTVVWRLEHRDRTPFTFERIAARLGAASLRGISLG